jgi:thymidylate synthase (FAD)
MTSENILLDCNPLPDNSDDDKLKLIDPKKVKRNLINDPYFKIEIDHDGSSPQPLRSIWRAQHTCVAEGFAMDDKCPDDPFAVIEKHQLRVKHWSVLEFAHVVIHFKGYPHDTVMQMVRHQDSKPLVQSMRYTGERISSGSLTISEIEKLFYIKPVGKYPSRNGIREFTQARRGEYLDTCYVSAYKYATAIEAGEAEEDARRLLAAGYRQNFVMAGSIRAVWHWLDQRTLADSQGECQALAWKTLDALEVWQPQLFGWYRKNRAGKAILTP